jgi:hypothetical protein
MDVGTLNNESDKGGCQWGLEADCGQNHIIIAMDPVTPIKKQIAYRCEVVRFKLSLSVGSLANFKTWLPFEFRLPGQIGACVILKSR